MSYTKNQRKHHNRQIKRKSKKSDTYLALVSKNKTQENIPNNHSQSKNTVLSLFDCLKIFFPNVLSNLIEEYTRFCGNMIDTKKIIKVIPNNFVVFQKEIYILDHEFTIHVYDFDSCILLRKFDVGSNFSNNIVSIMFVTTNYIHINCGICSCCISKYIILCKKTGLFFGDADGDCGRHLEYKIHADKICIHTYDPLNKLSIECSPMYMRYFNNFEKIVQTNFHEENCDFDCDETCVFYINIDGLNIYDLKTRSIRKINLRLSDEKNPLGFSSIFIVDNVIMLRSFDEIHIFDKKTFEHIHTNKMVFNYSSKTSDNNSHIFMHVFKNKLFIQNDQGFVHVYELY